MPQLQNSPVLADSDLVVAERNGNQFQMIESKYNTNPKEIFFLLFKSAYC